MIYVYLINLITLYYIWFFFSGVLKENVSMMDRQWLMGDGVIGQITENVHIPAVVVYSSKREPALIHRKY